MRTGMSSSVTIKRDGQVIRLARLADGEGCHRYEVIRADDPNLIGALVEREYGSKHYVVV